MIVSFFASAYSSRGVAIDLSFGELAQVLEESSKIERPSCETAKLTAVMLSPAIYEDGAARSAQNALGADVIALDLDAGDWTIFAAAAWCRARSLAHIVHTTTKCRAEHHRFRVVLPFSRRVGREEYPSAWAAVSNMLPAQVDRATKDISRLSVAPYCWEGAFNCFIAEIGEPLDIDKAMTDFGHPRTELRASPLEMDDKLSRTSTSRRQPSRADSAYASAALAGEEERVRRSRSGERNSILVRAAFSLGQLISAGLLERTLVEEVLTAASALPSSEKRSVIERGIEAGLRTPRR